MIGPNQAQAQARQVLQGQAAAHAHQAQLQQHQVAQQQGDADQVHELAPDFARLADLSRRLGATGVNVHANYPAGYRDRRGEAVQVAVRSFAPAAGVPEDPVCGSGNACVALQRRARGEHHDYTATQGEAIGREGRITVAYRGEAIEVGGNTVVGIEGRINLD